MGLDIRSLSATYPGKHSAVFCTPHMVGSKSEFYHFPYTGSQSSVNSMGSAGHSASSFCESTSAKQGSAYENLSVR